MKYFICGTVAEIVPVCGIDGKSIGVKVPGDLTSMFSQEYRKKTDKYGMSVY